MQRYIATGNLTKDLELRYTNDNKPVIETVLAVRRGFTDETDFITIQVWNKQAENLSKYCGKGSKILVEGEIRVTSYKNKEDKTIYKTYVLVNSIEFLDSKKNENNKESEQKEEVKKEEKVETSDPYQNFANEFEITNDMLPF